MQANNEEVKIKKTIFLDRLSKIFNIGPDLIEALLSKKPNQSLKLNTQHSAFTDKLKKFSTEPDLQKLPWSQNSYVIKNNKNKFTSDPLFNEGAYYIQNASSFLPIIALDPKPNDVILDMCSSPGGKLFNICQDSENKSYIYVNDENSPRLAKLKQTVKRYNLNVLHFFNQPGQYLFKNTDQTFDKILIDAPCSGEGEIDLSNSNSLDTWSLNKIKRLPKLQLSLLNSAYLMLNKGGTLVYSTCTFAPEENEQIVDQFITKHPDMSLCTFDVCLENLFPGLPNWENTQFSSSISKCARVIPNDYMEGFFVAKLIKA